ncbi:hypothetical protein HW561_12135 [Rhodobacteraceae bacterium B1Z28]|uniref:Uncharacterized protein n=1 Tax=Ruegeria haliotis TaxID=2747601 RepID=A0ABX2PTS0_9RHOB|nr:hypothetical protein [Ruegeria haliotis]NVO56537.1 hypothetical protein [Ruegeria haliotis]
MNTNTSNQKTGAEEALELLEQAWAYYTPEPLEPVTEREPELFEYANAA